MNPSVAIRLRKPESVGRFRAYLEEAHPDIDSFSFYDPDVCIDHVVVIDLPLVSDDAVSLVRSIELFEE